MENRLFCLLRIIYLPVVNKRIYLLCITYLPMVNKPIYLLCIVYLPVKKYIKIEYYLSIYVGKVVYNVSGGGEK